MQAGCCQTLLIVFIVKWLFHNTPIKQLFLETSSDPKLFTEIFSDSQY